MIYQTVHLDFQTVCQGDFSTHTWQNKKCQIFFLPQCVFWPSTCIWFDRILAIHPFRYDVIRLMLPHSPFPVPTENLGVNTWLHGTFFQNTHIPLIPCDSLVSSSRVLSCCRGTSAGSSSGKHDCGCVGVKGFPGSSQLPLLLLRAVERLNERTAGYKRSSVFKLAGAPQGSYNYSSSYLLPWKWLVTFYNSEK